MIIFPSITAFPVPEQSSIITVDDEGDGDFITLQEAIKYAQDGDTIMVYSGVYKDRINITKQLILKGIDNELGSGDDEGSPIIITNEDVGALIVVEADYCELSGLRILPGIPEGDEYGNNGIALHSKKNLVHNNTIETGNRGIVAYVGKQTADCSENKIYNNSISGFTVAIQIEGHHCEIANNQISNNTFGIHIFDANDVIVKHNNFKENMMHAFIFWIPFSYNIYYPRPTGITFDGNYYDNWIIPFPKPILRGFAPLLIPMVFSILFDMNPALDEYNYG